MEPLVAEQRTWRRARGGGGGWAGGGAEGGAAAAAALAEERAAAGRGGREGRKRRRRAGRRARGSGIEAVERREPGSRFALFAARAFGGATVESVPEKRAPAALVLAPGGGGLGRREGGSLRWFSRYRALLAFLPAWWAPLGVSLASGAPLPAPRGMS